MSELEWIKWGFLFVLGGFMYMLKRELSSKDEEIQTIRLELQKIKDTYVHVEVFKDFKTDLRAMFDELKHDIRALREKS